jgi:hypothetical protein
MGPCAWLRCALVLTVAAVLRNPIPAIADAGPPAARAEYDLRAAVSLTAPQIEGSVDVRFRNGSPRTLREAVFILFPNRFSTPDRGINDFNRPFVYPEEDFDPGSMEVLEARDAGTVVPVEPIQAAGVPDGCLVRLAIAPLPPGEGRTLSLRFRTVVPYRFGTFGRFDSQLTLNGGWYPYLARIGPDGAWRTDEPPGLADFEIHLTFLTPLDVVLNGAYFAPPAPINARVSAVHYLSLVAAPKLLRTETSANGTRIIFFRRPPRYTMRISSEPEPEEIMLETLREIVSLRPPGGGQPPDQLVVVEAPLRLNLTAPGEGMVLVSDRALKVHWLVRPFHELQVAQGVYAELLRPTLAAREPHADYWWVSEGLARVQAQRFVAQARPGTRSVQDWIDQFRLFSIVDRFESEPKIPFVDAFFESARVADPLAAEVTTFNNSLPPGRVVLGKLRQAAGQDTFDAIVDRCTGGTTPFRACAATVAGRDVHEVFEQWLQPYPALNYRFEAVDLNAQGHETQSSIPQGSGGASATYHHAVTIARESSRPVTEPVTVRLRSVGGRDVDLHWDSKGDVGRLTATTSRRVCQAVIDPGGELLEDRRDDNARPPRFQVVLDTAEVEVSSTEFGLSGLVVGRARYDYRKDLALFAYYTNRSIGADLGPRLHWGTPIDATSHRHNVYAFYGFQSLNGSFKENGQPSMRTPGQLAGLGARYEYTNVFALDNPTDERQVRLYVDWYDRSLGGDYDYVDWGVDAVGTHPLWSYRAVGAVELLNGFSEPLGGSVVPNQGLYSLGGSRSIRGIGAEDQLARNILLLRTELRYDVYPELDLNFLDALVLRRGQLRLFADSGQVSNSAGRIYDVSSFAVGIGVGFGAVYEFLGFFPSIAYVEIATRVDEPSKAGDVQFLFGTRQAF